jgi:hypothetical protein
MVQTKSSKKTLHLQLNNSTSDSNSDISSDEDDISISTEQKVTKVTNLHKISHKLHKAAFIPDDDE